MSVIRIENVHKVYHSGKNSVHALRGVDLTVDRGEMLAVMGTSGSGKSTMMNILGCLDTPTSGSYELDGVRVDGMSRDQLADLRNQKLGFVFQGFNLLARTTALENVELPMLYGRHRKVSMDEIRERALHCLEIVGLAKRADHFPNQLSGGQQQRVAIARALINDPAIILADEPTGNLDSSTGAEIMQIMQRLNEEGRTIIMVTHEPDVARQADRQLYMRDGVIAGEGIFPG